MDEEALWTPHLSPGERIVWRAGASPRLRRAEVARRRTVAILLGLACLVLAAAFAYKLYESLFLQAAPSLDTSGPGAPNPGAPSLDPSTPGAPSTGGSSLGAAIAVPLYVALSLTFAVVFIAQLTRLNPKLTRSVHYAATPTRLIALDASGALLEEVDAQDIAGLILGGRRSAPDLFVLRRHDDKNVNAFAIEHIDKPFEAKAIIEETFLEPSDEQAD